MRILAVSDPHGDMKAFRAIRRKAKEADCIMVAGDMTLFSDRFDRIMDAMESWGKPTMVLPGNHETPKDLKAACRASENLIYLDESSYTIEDHLFIGIAGSGFSSVDKRFERSARRFIKMIHDWQNSASRRYILMTHAPPFNTRCDMLRPKDHCGNRSIRDFIEKTQPDLAVCGHIHESFGTEDRIGKTIITNPGPFGKVYEV